MVRQRAGEQILWALGVVFDYELHQPGVQATDEERLLWGVVTRHAGSGDQWFASC